VVSFDNREEVTMNVGKILSALTVGAFIVLAAPTQGVKALPRIDPNPVFASREKMTIEVSSQRSHVKHRHWRHRGGRHPFYGSRH
jgi:hypothetical protein